MLVMFVCYELEYEAYGVFLPYAVILGVFVTVLGTISYFLYDPYIQDKKRLRNAQNQIREIERIAEKEVRKKQKIREKEERNTQKLLEREERKSQPVSGKTETAESSGQGIPAKIAGFLARFRKQDESQVEVVEEEKEETIEAGEQTMLTENELPHASEPESNDRDEQNDES